MHKPFYPVIPLLGIPSSDVQNDIYTRLFIAALFVKAKMKTTKKRRLAQIHRNRK